jgi:hypothetical protein
MGPYAFVDFPIEKIGGKRIEGGDNDIWTKESSKTEWTVFCELKTTADRTGVIAHIKFTVRETKSNYTEIRGETDRLIWSCPNRDEQITEVRVVGNNPVNASGVIHGKKHDFVDVTSEVPNTFFNHLEVRVDSDESDDTPFVGCKGRVNFTVVTQVTQPFPHQYPLTPLAITAVGCGATKTGDSDVWTQDGHDTGWAVSCELKTTPDRTGVIAHTQFTVQETQADYTRIEGEAEQTIWSCPSGEQIQEIHVAGGNLAVNKSGVIHGKKHDFVDVTSEATNTFFNHLEVRVDSDESDDRPYVGCKGTVTFTVVTQPATSSPP